MAASMTDLASAAMRDARTIAPGDVMRLANGILMLSALIEDDQVTDNEMRAAARAVLSGNGALADA